MAMVNVTPLVGLVNTYKDKQYVEIETRIGKFENGKFNTDLGKTTFETLKRRLSRYTGWEAVRETTDDVYYWDDIRGVYSPDGTVTFCKKHRVVKKDLNKFVRFAVSQEVPVFTQPEEDATRHVCRRRISFVRKNLSIDLTEVVNDPDDIDCEDETVSYQCELEIIDPKKLSNDAEIENALYKVNDVLALISHHTATE